MLNVCRPQGRLFFWFLVMVMVTVSVPRAVAEGPSTTTVVDVIYRADGTAAQGTLLISWPAFTTKGGQPVAAGVKSVKIGAGGAISLALAANTGADPAGTHYRVVLKLDDGTTSTEYWTVPDAPTTTVSAIRSKVVPATVAAQFVGRDYVDSLVAWKATDAAVMHKDGDETIAGVKTFSVSPLVPVPVADQQVTNKQYVDTSVASASGGAGKVELNPTASQRVNQPAGTALEVNRLASGDVNGMRFADRFANIAAAITDAGAAGSVVIPAGYAGRDAFTNPDKRPVLDLRELGAFRGGYLSVKDFGARGDAQFYQTCSMAAGNKRLTCWYFSASDLGKQVKIQGAGPGGVALVTTITNYVGIDKVDVADAASTTISNKGAVWGWQLDDSPAFQAAADYCSTAGCTVNVPQGTYILGSTVKVTSYSPATLRTSIRCMGGMNSTRLVWTGASNGRMLQAGDGTAGNYGGQMTVEGCGFHSVDDAHLAVGIYWASGKLHEAKDNYFGILQNGIGASGTWLNVVDHNFFYGPVDSCIKWDATLGPVINTHVQRNEFGICGNWAIESASSGSGGANWNVYSQNDFEHFVSNYHGATTVGAVKLGYESRFTFAWNRFEDKSTESGNAYRQLFLDNSQGVVENNGFGLCSGANCGDYNVTLSGSGSNGNRFIGNMWYQYGRLGMIDCVSSNSGSGTLMIADSGFTRAAGVSANCYGIEQFSNAGAPFVSGGMKAMGGTSVENAYKTDVLQFNGTSLSALNADSANLYSVPTLPASSTWPQYSRVLSRAPDVNTSSLAYGATGWICLQSGGCSNPVSTSQWAEMGTFRKKKVREGTAAPTTFTWAVGDVVYNTAATEQGTAGGKYLVIGWYCVAGGTPGTWLPMRVLTGN